MRTGANTYLKWIRLFTSIAAVLGAIGTTALAANIDSAGKYAWSSQVGWVNHAPSDGGGVTVVSAGANGYLFGYAWAENIGWIKLGSGTGPYANTGAADWGVNMDASGNLSGYAWSSQAGWINFNSTHSQVAVNTTTGEFSGEAWGENVGWVGFRDTSPAYGVRTTAFDAPPAANIDSAGGQYAWAENAGWLNLATTFGGVTVVPNGANGYLAGYAWAENFGWVKLGDGSGPYLNNSATDWGVNMDATGNLSGYGWSENAGWINFQSAPHGQVTINTTSGEFNGFAWGEKIGWVHFRDTASGYGVRTTVFGVPFIGTVFKFK